LARTQARRRDQLHSIQGRAKCHALPKLRELVIGIRDAAQGSK